MNTTNVISPGLPRDQFELLSAYLDGELTATERRQVEGWLADDPKTQVLYQRLLALRQGFQQLSVPTQVAPWVDPAKAPAATTGKTMTGEAMAAQVLERLDRRRNQRWLWPVGPIAAAVAAGLVFSLGLGQTRLTPQLVKLPLDPNSITATGPVKIAIDPNIDPSGADDLTIMLDRPIIAIPTEAPETVIQGE
jgi:anti-sigma factor RsiW